MIVGVLTTCHLILQMQPNVISFSLLNKKTHILLSEVYCAWQVVKTQTVILNNPVESQRVHI